MLNIFNYITIGSALFLILLILVQTRGAGLGAGFGSAAEIETVRRGSEKTIFQMTIVVAIIFVTSIILGIISK
ncbi:MAG TPA: preprotein translocase subunit SecG [Patescibacteria group bacterium]|nr:preprotein translocase subunit SecG [Patescibacteria group bacterium]